MLLKVLENREVYFERDYEEENEGSQNENRITTINLEVPEDYAEFIKKIVFITEDGNFFDYITESDTYIFKNNITKYKKVKAYIWLTNSSTSQDFRSRMFELEFNYNENPSTYVPSEEEQTQFDLMVEELEALIEEVRELEVDLSGVERTSNKKTRITSSSTDTDYPSSKAVWTLFNSITNANNISY